MARQADVRLSLGIWAAGDIILAMLVFFTRSNANCERYTRWPNISEEKGTHERLNDAVAA